MGNSGWTADPQDITVPPGAGPSDPRIYIGPDDPIADALGQDAAIAMYWDAGKAFMMIVNNSGGVQGQFSLLSVDSNTMQLYDHISLGHYNDGITQEGSTSLAGGALLITEYDSAPNRMVIQYDLEAETVYYGKSAGRGLWNRVSSVGSTGFLAAEGVAFTLPAETYLANRAYKICISEVMVSNNVPGTGIYHRLRRTNLAGAVVIDFTRAPAQNPFNTGHYDESEFRVGAADVTDTLVVTIQPNPAAGGSVLSSGSAARGRYVEIWDIGAAADFPDMPFL